LSPLLASVSLFLGSQSRSDQLFAELADAARKYGAKLEPVMNFG
jgi:hypothetical protein